MKLSKEGFALVDALTAVTLLALTLSLALGSVTTARRVADKARVKVAVAQALKYASVVPLPAAQHRGGGGPSARWEATSSQLRLVDRMPIVVCERTIRIAPSAGSAMEVRSLESCPPEDAQ